MKARVRMNKIEAIIRPEKLASVKDALAEKGLVGLNVAPSQAEGDRGEWWWGVLGAWAVMWAVMWWTCFPK
jgi:hypothetical protein